MADTIDATDTLTARVVGSIQLAGAEISAYDSTTKRVFTTSSEGLQIIDLSDPSNPQLIDTVQFPFSNDLTSVAVRNGLVAVAVAAPNRTDPGKVFLLNADGNILGEFTVGSLPDMLTFSADGSTIFVVNEGEATLLDDLDAGASYANPVGSISVIEVATGTVKTAGFDAFNDDVAALIAEGVRLYVNTPGFEGISVAQDLEPEYLALSPDGQTAWVTLQEANAIAVVDLGGAAPVVTDIIPLGLKNWDGLNFDPSDSDGGIHFRDDLPIFGMYMPDAIASFETSGQTYYITANEGDDRSDFIDGGETARLRSLGSTALDPTVFPDAATLRGNTVLGRLNVPILDGLDGDTDGDGDIDVIQTYGGRSFTIFDASGNVVFESGDRIDTAIAQFAPELYDDTRSDNKGSEPEGVAVATFDGQVYAFIALERYNSTIVFNLTDPSQPTLTTIFANQGDVGPESGFFVSAADSATGQPLFVVSSEVSGTLTVYQLGESNLVGTNGEDTLLGTISADLLTGLNGKDFIFGNFGADEIFGGNGDDVLDGGYGDDLLNGGRGNDVLTTGAGEDIVAVGTSGGADLVMDFDTEHDVIRFEQGVTVRSQTVADYNADGVNDLILHITSGGGSLVLLGVSDPLEVTYIV